VIKSVVSGSVESPEKFDGGIVANGVLSFDLLSEDALLWNLLNL
jgi:hypothetical protein